MSRLDELSPAGSDEYRSLISRIVITSVAVVVRFGCKLHGKKNKLGWDDLWIVIAMCFNYGQVGLTFWGLIRTQGELSVPQLLKAGKLREVQDYFLAVYIGATFWYATITFVCISIISFYARIFDVEPKFSRNSWILLGITALWGISSVLGNTLICIPPSNFWKMQDLDKCGNYSLFLLITSTFEIVISSAILALPVRPVLKLSLALNTRLSILGIFLLGSFVVVSGIVRIAIVYRAGMESPDYHTLRLWGDIHTISAIVCACLPVYRPVWNPIVGVSRALYGYSRSLLHSRSNIHQELSTFDIHSTQRRGSGSYSNLVDEQTIGPSKSSRGVRSNAKLERPS